MNEDISKIISEYKMYMSFNGNEYQMIQKVELNKTFEEIERLNNIIKEAIEYIKSIPDDEFVESEHFTELLFIFGKVGSDKE